MKNLIPILLCALIFGCKKQAEQITATTVSVYLNESNCSIYEKIMSGALKEHQILILESAPLFSLFQSNKANADLIKFYTENFLEGDGVLSQEKHELLAKLQSKHISWSEMTVSTQKLVTDLVFRGCTASAN
ncbi:hypothetical protein [Stutzerimonas stutzeri]|uniref:hypothetical protein n=1 Tax=Stutzerimonas stutzeri TaxID=316 RepID=UPI0012DAC4D6|nr:hypothetical protein [Stutzerimonas stutzeri]